MFCGAQLLADQQAGEVARRRRGREPLEQGESANSKRIVQQTLTLACAPHAVEERRFVERRVGLRGARQDRVLRKQAVDFARHIGAKAGDAAAAHRHPLVVRARQDEQPIGDAGKMQRAEDLHLLAAHHIGHATLFDAEARNDGDAAGLNPVQAVRQLIESGGTRRIGRFLPTLAAAGHAGDQAEAARFAHPFGELSGEGSGKVAAGHVQDAERRALFGEHLARFVEEGTPQRGGAPVDGN
jgi:hypothetical protein